MTRQELIVFATASLIVSILAVLVKMWKGSSGSNLPPSSIVINNYHVNADRQQHGDLIIPQQPSSRSMKDPTESE
jgi:hypothetical protein